MPFWVMRTFAPDFWTFVTMSFSVFSSWSRKAESWLGWVISILASTSVFLISRAALTRAILAFLTLEGMPVWTRSLSRMMPWMSSVSSMEPPLAFWTRMFSSMSTVVSLLLPLPVASATEVQARTTMSEMSSELAERFLLCRAVVAMFFSVAVSFFLMVMAMALRTLRASFAARL